MLEWFRKLRRRCDLGGRDGACPISRSVEMLSRGKPRLDEGLLIPGLAQRDCQKEEEPEFSSPKSNRGDIT
jgi:hypothetical protein